MSTNGAAAVDEGMTASLAEGPERYLGRAEEQMGLTFSTLVLCNFVFRDDTVLLLRLTDDFVSGEGRICAPFCRLVTTSVTASNPRFPIDRFMSELPTMDSFARDTIRIQAGLDPGADLTAPEALHTRIDEINGSGNSALRVTLLWRCEQESPRTHPVANGRVFFEPFWATEEEVADIRSDQFALDVKSDILTGFDLRRRDLQR